MVRRAPAAAAAATLLAGAAVLVLGQAPRGGQVIVGNEFLRLTFQTAGGKLVPVSLENRVTRESLDLSGSDGFAMHLGEPDPLAEKKVLRLGDFELTAWDQRGTAARFDLRHAASGLTARWRWEAAAKAPYVRSWIEVENAGNAPLAVADADPLTLSYGVQRGNRHAAEIFADSESTNSIPGASAWSAIDGDPKTHWVSARSADPHWLALVLPRPVEISRLVISVPAERADAVRAATVETREGGGEWVEAGRGGGSGTLTVGFARPARADRLRVRLSGNEQPAVAELEIFDAAGARIPLEDERAIPAKRTSAVGHGEGVALTAGDSVFAALEALIYDHRIGVARDGRGFRVGHNPGWNLEPKARAVTKKAVLGVAPKGKAGPWFVEKYLTPNWRQTRQGNPQWDRYWAYNITADEKWSLGTDEMLLLLKALAKAREAYGFGFQYVGPDITAFVKYQPFQLGLNRSVFPDGYDRVADAIEAIGSKNEGYYGIGRVEDVRTPAAAKAYRDTLTALVDRYRIKLLVCDAYVGGLGGHQIYWREKVWDNFRETVEALQQKYPDMMIGLESYSPNLVTRWLWVNTQFDHHASHYRRYSPDADLNNVRAELIPDAGAGSAPVLHGRDVVTASAGVYSLYGVPWRGPETFGPLWQLVYDTFYQGPAAMERSRDNWVMNLFGTATVISPITYGRIFGQPPEDWAWLGRMLKLRNDNLDVLKECTPRENGDIFHFKEDRGMAVFRHLRWEAGAEKSFRLDSDIGLAARGRTYLVRQLYPAEEVLTQADGNWRWRYGDTVRFRMNPFEVRLLAVAPAESVTEEVLVGAAYERDESNALTLLGLPGRTARVRAVIRGKESPEREFRFEGPAHEGEWYGRLAAFARAETTPEQRRELLAGVDYVKTAAYPDAWRQSNIYGLLEWHRKHPFPHAEIEQAREIKMEAVHASKRWFCDGDMNTPPRQKERSIQNAPLILGGGMVQADLGKAMPLRRIRAAVAESPASLAASLSPDGRRWIRKELRRNGEYWESEEFDETARYLRLDADSLTVQEFQAYARGESSMLDWSLMEPYPISLVRSQTTPRQVDHVWKAELTLPRATYEGQQIAVPVWLERPVHLSGVWVLARVGAEPRAAYRIVPGYAKEGASWWAMERVLGLTWRMPVSAADAGKRVELALVSAEPVSRAEAWLVSDPPPHVRVPFTEPQVSRQAHMRDTQTRDRGGL